MAYPLKINSKSNDLNPSSRLFSSFISSSSSLNFVTSKFCSSLLRLTLFGMTMIPFCIMCLINTCAGDLLCFLLILFTTGLFKTSGTLKFDFTLLTYSKNVQKNKMGQNANIYMAKNLNISNTSTLSVNADMINKH